MALLKKHVYFNKKILSNIDTIKIKSSTGGPSESFKVQNNEGNFLKVFHGCDAFFSLAHVARPSIDAIVWISQVYTFCTVWRTKHCITIDSNLFIAHTNCDDKYCNLHFLVKFAYSHFWPTRPPIFGHTESFFPDFFLRDETLEPLLKDSVFIFSTGSLDEK